MITMDESFQARLRRTALEVEQDPVGGLSFATRKDLLRALGPLVADAEGRHTIVGPGLRRRARLGITVARRVLPSWEASYATEDPHRLLALAEAYLAGSCSRDRLRSEASDFGGALNTSDTPQRQLAYLAARSSVCAAYVALSDELLEADEGISEEELDDPQDPDCWDCAYWAAAASSGGMSWESGFDVARHRAFWIWYVAVAVPDAAIADGPSPA